MLKEKFNYSLNGIEHEIITDNRIKINKKPFDDKILISNKFLLKYVNDLFDYYNIEYCLLNQCLLGQYVFQGIHIFDKTLEIGTLQNNLVKIKKIEQEIKDDDIQIQFIENHAIKLTANFFSKQKVHLWIYLFDHIDNHIHYFTQSSQKIIHPFYDIFPIKKDKFEEFTISIPNKIENVLISYGFSLQYIIFSDNLKDSIQIVEEKEKETYYEKILSYVKPFLF